MEWNEWSKMEWKVIKGNEIELSGCWLCGVELTESEKEGNDIEYFS